VNKSFLNIYAWIIEADISNIDAISNYQLSTAHVANTIAGLLIDEKIAHNLIVSDKGRRIVVIPRNCTKQDWKICTGWVDLCGLIRVKDSETLEKGEINDFIKNQVGINEDLFNTLSSIIIKKFGSIYKIDESS
jgi:hypothetical protein